MNDLVAGFIETVKSFDTEVPQYSDAWLIDRDEAMAAMRELLWARQFICRKCGLREELGIKPEVDF